MLCKILTFVLVMAAGGGDADRTEQIKRDIEMVNAETFLYNVDVQNRYESRSGSGNDGFEFVDRGPKRKRISTGSTSSVYRTFSEPWNRCKAGSYV